MKTKLRGHVQVVQDDNDELIMGDDVFQLNELVDPYRVTLSNDLEENSIFCITKNTLVDIDVEKLNDVLRISRHIEIDEDDDNDNETLILCDFNILHGTGIIILRVLLLF